MASLLKMKLAVSGVAISIMILVSMLESNFNASVSIKKWSRLTWDDFKGFPRPFSGYGAVISSQVYLEYDSAKEKYVAYAGQHNIGSWVKETTKTSDYALNHEQYHFNITELHARQMNQHIDEYPNESKNFYEGKLWSVHYSLRKMQNQYDDESNHSLIVDKQRHWEFKIDSMLSLTTADSGWVTDYYSGARAFFPDRPSFETNLTETSAYRQYTLAKYDMALSMTSYQYNAEKISIGEENLREHYSKFAWHISSFVIDTTHYQFKATIIANDTLDNNFHEIWVCNGSYLYNVSASFRENEDVTQGYRQMANSFISSFHIKDTDDYWFAKHDGSSSMPVQSTMRRLKRDEENLREMNCFTYGTGQQNGFFRGPMFYPDSSMLIVHDIVTDAHSPLHKRTLIIDDRIHTYTPDSTDRLYFVPASTLPRKNFIVQFGYLLAQDSTENCYTFHHQEIYVNH